MFEVWGFEGNGGSGLVGEGVLRISLFGFKFIYWNVNIYRVKIKCVWFLYCYSIYNKEYRVFS